MIHFLSKLRHAMPCHATPRDKLNDKVAFPEKKVIFFLSLPMPIVKDWMQFVHLFILVQLQANEMRWGLSFSENSFILSTRKFIRTWITKFEIVKCNQIE